ncbi:MAG: pseudouridine synthase [bacterium]
MKERINKFLSNATGLSRRAVDKLIGEHRVSVNRKIAELGMFVDEGDEIEIDSEKVNLNKTHFTYIILNKPKGIITTRNDDKGRETVMDLIPKKFAHLRPAGRLDCNTEGLIILTDDGEFINYLTHPKNKVKKVYHALVFGRVKEGEIERMKKGLYVENTLLKVDKIVEKHYYESKDKSEIEVYITHGKNHEIRNILKAVGHPVISLARISIGNLKVFKMVPGEFRQFTKDQFTNE